jgi:rhomboid family GlyGly-CTERM serine protease
MQTENGGNFTEQWRQWSVPLLLSAVSLLVMLGGDGVAAVLRYDRAALSGGELWRLLTAHVAHLGWSHLALNLAGLALVWLLCGRSLSLRLWWLLLFVCAMGVSGGLMIFNPDLAWYVGLSGVLHGMIVAGAVAGAYQRERDSLLLLVLVTLKLGWEQWHGPMPGSEMSAGGRVVVDAHLYGALSALLLMAALLAVPAGRRSLAKRAETGG